MEQMPLEFDVHLPQTSAREEAAAPRAGQSENNRRSVTKTLTVAVSIVRILEVILTCISFSLVASMGNSTIPQWTFCMFTWCFCFCVTLLILLLELTGLSNKLPISWDDFTIAFSRLAGLMVLMAPYVYFGNIRVVGVAIASWLTFILYVIEVPLICAKSGENRGFMSTVPGLLKVLEAFFSCIIFFLLNQGDFSGLPWLQWCATVYSICFIFSVVIIVSSICRVRSRFPALFNRVLIVCNVLAMLMYITAVVILPLYMFRDGGYCSPGNNMCMFLAIIFQVTCVNLTAFIVDTVYSCVLVFCSPDST